MTFMFKVIFFCQKIYLKTRKSYLSKENIDSIRFYPALGLAWVAALKRENVELVLLRYMGMFLMIESGIRCGKRHSVLC